MFSCLLILIDNHKTALIPSQKNTALFYQKNKRDCINNESPE